VAVDGILHLEKYIRFSHIVSLFHLKKNPTLIQYCKCGKTVCLGSILRDLKSLCRSFSCNCYQFYAVLSDIWKGFCCGQYLVK